MARILRYDVIQNSSPQEPGSMRKYLGKDGNARRGQLASTNTLLYSVLCQPLTSVANVFTRLVFKQTMTTEEKNGRKVLMKSMVVYSLSSENRSLGPENRSLKDFASLLSPKCVHSPLFFSCWV